MVRTGATFADAAAEWLRYVKEDRRRKHSTVVGYESIVRSLLLPRFGNESIESIAPASIEAWLASLIQGAEHADQGAGTDARHLPAGAQGVGPAE